MSSILYGDPTGKIISSFPYIAPSKPLGDLKLKAQGWQVKGIWGYIGIMYRGCVGIMENEMEATIL